MLFQFRKNFLYLIKSFCLATIVFNLHFFECRYFISNTGRIFSFKIMDYPPELCWICRHIQCRHVLLPLLVICFPHKLHHLLGCFCPLPIRFLHALTVSVSVLLSFLLLLIRFFLKTLFVDAIIAFLSNL